MINELFIPTFDEIKFRFNAAAVSKYFNKARAENIIENPGADRNDRLSTVILKFSPRISRNKILVRGKSGTHLLFDIPLFQREGGRESLFFFFSRTTPFFASHARIRKMKGAISRTSLFVKRATSAEFCNRVFHHSSRTGNILGWKAWKDFVTVW